MIDTVRFKLFPSPFLGSNDNWVTESGTRDRDEGPVAWKALVHPDSGLRVYGTEGMATTLEVSLPRLLFGSNGILLRFSDINTAYWAALDLASQVVEEINPEKLYRIDLVHHFQGWISDYIAALKGLKHRKVRRRCCEFFESSLEWPGKDIFIRLYDKKLELEKQAGPIQRLEFQLRNAAIENVWSWESGFDSEMLYKQYRRLCSGFVTRTVPKISSTTDLLCFLRQNSVLVGGIDPVERYLAGKSKRTRYRVESDMSGIRLSFFEATFLDYLPEDPADLQYLDVFSSKVESVA